MGRLYLERLAGLAGVQLPVEEPWARQVYWMFGIVLDQATGLDAIELARRLKAHGGRDTSVLPGDARATRFPRARALLGRALPSRQARRQGLYLPSGLTLTEAQIDHVCAALVGVPWPENRFLKTSTAPASLARRTLCGIVRY